MLIITDILNYVMEFFRNMYNVAQIVLIVFFTPLKDVGSTIASYTDSLPWLGELVDFLIETISSVGFMGAFNLSDFSLIVLMVGYGVFSYIIYQLVAWLLNIVT